MAIARRFAISTVAVGSAVTVPFLRQSNNPYADEGYNFFAKASCANRACYGGLSCGITYGYTCHQFIDPSTGQAVDCTESPCGSC